MKRWLAWMLAILLLCAGCSKTPPIKIGVIEPLSGEHAAAGQLEYQGIREALEVNPMLGEARIELIVADNQSTEEGARQAAKSLAEQGVQLVIGSWGSTLSRSAAEELSKRNIPMVTTTASKVENGSCFSLELSMDQQAQALAAWITEEGWTRVAMITDREQAYDMAMRQAVMEAAGADIFCAEAHTTGEDLAECIAAMEREQAQVLLIPSLADAAVTLTALPILGGDVCTADAVIRPIYGENGAKAVGYDGYLVALAILKGEAGTIDGQTGKLTFDGTALTRVTVNVKTASGVTTVTCK